MIPFLRKQFNDGFTPEKYQTFLRRIDEACGTHVQFRLSETPCFFPKELIDRMARDGAELIRQLVENPAYRAKSDEAVPAEFKVPNEPDHPMFVQVDFGLVRDAARRVAAQAGGVAGLPFPLCVSGAAGARAYIDVYRAFGLQASGFGLHRDGAELLSERSR